MTFEPPQTVREILRRIRDNGNDTSLSGVLFGPGSDIPDRDERADKVARHLHEQGLIESTSSGYGPDGGFLRVRITDEGRAYLSESEG